MDAGIGIEEIDTVIVGAGICGLATALALHRFLSFVLYYGISVAYPYLNLIIIYSSKKEKEKKEFDYNIILHCVQEGYIKCGYGKIRDSAHFRSSYYNSDKWMACPRPAGYRLEAQTDCSSSSRVLSPIFCSVPEVFKSPI